MRPYIQDKYGLVIGLIGFAIMSLGTPMWIANSILTFDSFWIFVGKICFIPIIIYGGYILCLRGYVHTVVGNWRMQTGRNPDHERGV